MWWHAVACLQNCYAHNAPAQVFLALVVALVQTCPTPVVGISWASAEAAFFVWSTCVRLQRLDALGSSHNLPPSAGAVTAAGGERGRAIAFKRSSNWRPGSGGGRGAPYHASAAPARRGRAAKGWGGGALPAARKQPATALAPRSGWLRLLPWAGGDWAANGQPLQRVDSGAMAQASSGSHSHSQSWCEERRRLMRRAVELFQRLTDEREGALALLQVVAAGVYC
jgi:hypothetical protein